MPTPTKLRLQDLEVRALLSAEYAPPATAVVTGTDAHDLITLTRSDYDHVTVTVQSFLDPEWTQPAADPVTSELSAWETFGINGGAGHDRVQIVDPTFGHVLLWGTNLRGVYPVHWTEVGPDGSVIVMTEEMETSYATLGATESAPATLTDGVELNDGTEVQLGFDFWIYIDDPIMIYPVDPPVGGPWIDILPPALEIPDGMTLEAPAIELVGVDEAVLIGEGDEVWPAVAFDPATDGEYAADEWSDGGDLADMWVEYADNLPADESNWWTGDGTDGSDWLTGEATDDWLVTDLESCVS
ncbi:MAG TPA: hypothetical protein VKD90_00615 [Gemmataceae bacterium]|nr:hypothetical protein [Gemmataceae bacterium]